MHKQVRSIASIRMDNGHCFCSLNYPATEARRTCDVLYSVGDDSQMGYQPYCSGRDKVQRYTDYRYRDLGSYRGKFEAMVSSRPDVHLSITVRLQVALLLLLAVQQLKRCTCRPPKLLDA
jgi:hypothetical protein